nr:uncharacterized protein LOC126055742 [Helicoverpa armigera]
MEDLLTRQAELTTLIERIFTNFKKENMERRKLVAKKKATELKLMFQEYKENDDVLKECKDRSSDYFTGGYFIETRNYYLEALNFIEQYIKQDAGENVTTSNKTIESVDLTKIIKQQEEHAETVTKSTEEKSETNNTNNKLTEKLRKQTANYRAFQRTISNIDVGILLEHWELEDAIKTLESRWKIIDCLHWEIESELEAEGKEELELLYDKYEKQYLRLKKSINSKMWSEKHRDKTTPNLEVPTFNGSYNQWVSFKDLFSEAIHNNPSLSKAQKMQFLKSKIRGEAERLIQHLPISSDNYTVCWDILNRRYNNKKLIFTSHINMLLDLPVLKHQALAPIKKMHDVTQECLNAITNLGVDISTWDPLLVHLLDQKLDVDSHSEYIDSLKDRRELPVLKDFLDFLEKKFTALESSRRKSETLPQKFGNQYSQQNPSTSYGKLPYHRANNYFNYNKGSADKQVITKSTCNITTIKCPLCNNGHGLYNCKRFLEMSSEQKLKTVKELKVCMNCLFSHNGNPCKSPQTCRKCSKKHNTIIHDACNIGYNTSTTNVAKQNEIQNPHVRQSNENDLSAEVLLSTAMLKVKGTDGTYHDMRALIDQGSQVSLITERAAQQLNLKRQHCKGTVIGVGEKENSGKGLLNIHCRSIYSDYEFRTDVIIMNSLIGNLPNKTFKKPNWNIIENISLADPDFYISRPIDILLGADVYSLILLSGMIKGDESTQPVVQQTKLGWLLCGTAKTYQCNIVHNIEQIQKFWEIEEISEQSPLSVQDQQCITFYNETTTRKEDGRYVVRLPLKEDITSKLGSSKQTALAQFRTLENKFKRQPKLAQDYKNFMNEYKTMEHMIPTTISNQTPEYYLPHHGVERVDSLTTQYRVVFNGSHKTNTGYSLNDLMHTGPNLQIDLQTLLLKWRQYKYAFTSDIEKMFRFIAVDERDQKYQKIFWRESLEHPIQTFCLTTVTYGTRAAPFLAIMTLRKLAADERETYPEASKVVESAFYMDDLVHGTNTIEDGKQLISDLNALMKLGGFNLRKWSSNEKKLLDNIKKDGNKSNNEVFTFKTENISKTLGLCWNSTEDKLTFQYNTNKPKDNTRITKRTLLSEISKVFDPLGWMAPLSTKLKLLFQRVWKKNMKWDDEVPIEIQKEWIKIKSELGAINQYEVPRWIRSRKEDIIELHGFCDASLVAFACVLYARVNDETEPVLLAAKTKLVPHKKAVTLPRLELSGAHLLAKLMKKTQDALSEHKTQIYGWTDSMVVLGWIQGEPTRWKTFVANRVQQIVETIPSTCWRYVKSGENPADVASRGLYAQQLRDNILWWHGPSWLTTFENQEQETPTYTTEEEVRLNKSCTVKEQEENIIETLLHKHSSFNKVNRIIAWLLRAFAPKRTDMPSYLTLHELTAAKLLIIKNVQQMEFRSEIECLRNKQRLSTKSKILNLNPFIDSSGVLRIGGRLENSTLNMEMKHPKIIPRDSRLAELLVDEAHKLTFHGGPRLTLANLRQQYWIPGGNNAVKKRLRNCVICRKNNPQQHQQIMGDLPTARTEPAPPFYHTGVDYTGFVEIKSNKTRNARSMKGYIALFICMVTKAIHLELVTDLTSTAFLAALRRMTARRGAPRYMYSDCGTNFVGADRILQQEHEQVQQTFDNNFMGILADMNIEWHFNAPSWPSAGGLWERAVRSLKHHLRRVIGSQKLTFEEYYTILTQIEACLNSRPLCALTENIDDLDYLSPAHFLTGRAGVTIIETPEDGRTRWYLTNQLFQQIWKRWKSEYLSQLNARNKWLKPQDNIQVGNLVIIQDENLPAGKWAMARVVELHPGRDGYVRVVSLKTQHGIIKRPIVKLCLLPIRPAQDEPETKTDNKQTKQTGKKGNKRHCISATLYSVVMALTFFMTLISNAYGTSNITQLNENQAIYFDPIAKMQLIRHQWTLVAYYDMSPYWEGITAFKKYSSYLEQSCNRMNNTNKCNMIVPQQSHEYTELQYYNQLLLTQHFIEHSRRRRGLINGIGYLANGLFGVLDERFAEQYAQDIELIKRNEAHLKNLWSNQTSVVESEYNLIKRMEKMVAMQHKVINKHLNSLDKALNTIQAEVNEITKQQEFILTAIAANTVLAPINHIINLTIDQGYEDNLDNQSNETETVHNNLLREIDLKLKQLKEEQKYEKAGIQPRKRRSTKLNQCPGLLGSTNTNRKLKKNTR